MKSSYESWLKQQGYASATVQAQMHRAGRVEECYGDLDEHYDRDQLRGVIGELKYSTADERSNKPNPSKIPFSGDTRNNLASYRNATERYCKFRRVTQDEDIGPEIRTRKGEGGNESADDGGQLVGLERDLQAALRRAIEQLEPGLEIIDDGAERSVASKVGSLAQYNSLRLPCVVYCSPSPSPPSPYPSPPKPRATPIPDG